MLSNVNEVLWVLKARCDDLLVASLDRVPDEAQIAAQSSLLLTSRSSLVAM
jgi:hypothetical protein